MANAFAGAGVTVYRFDLPFRRRRPQGPPHPGGASEDRAGIREAVQCLRKFAAGRIFIGGHSYGGRQASMLAAEDAEVADGLLLLSYPLHPPNRPEQLRTAHFPQIRIPAFFVHGTRDPFATTDELSLAIQAIPGRKSVLTMEGAGHSLKPQIGREVPPAFLSWLGAQDG
jgi:predicted alpha/beta-hydrolase family hydrolase